MKRMKPWVLVLLLLLTWLLLGCWMMSLSGQVSSAVSRCAVTSDGGGLSSYHLIEAETVIGALSVSPKVATGGVSDG